MASTPHVRPHMRRAIPTQARSANTVEKILDSASSILIERGLQNLNTNAVAQQAGINVATLYHYFPDKVAILAELFRRDQVVRIEYLATRLAEFPDVLDPTEWVSGLVHSLVQLRRENPTMVVLRRACRTVPQLLALEEAELDRMVEYLGRVIRRRWRRLSPARARHISRTLLESGATLLDRASSGAEDTAGLIRETILMYTCYFEHLERGG